MHFQVSYMNDVSGKGIRNSEVAFEPDALAFSLIHITHLPSVVRPRCSVWATCIKLLPSGIEKIGEKSSQKTDKPKARIESHSDPLRKISRAEKNLTTLIYYLNITCSVAPQCFFKLLEQIAYKQK